MFLGHEISCEGLHPPSNKLDIIADYPTPTSRKELQRAIGMFNWFKKYIRNFSAIANPLYKLMKKGIPFKWTSECSEAFSELKDSLLNSEALAFPRYNLEFRLAVDTSSKGIGIHVISRRD